MIAEFLFKNPRLLVLAIVVIAVAGSSSFLVMPRIEDPVLGQRVALVSTVFPGANAQRVESLVTIPLEDQLSGIPKIKLVRSNSHAGLSNIVIELKDEVDDVESVWTLVRDQVSAAEADLPESCSLPDLEVLPLKAFAAIVAVQWQANDEPNLSILRRLARELRANMVAIPGTERVDVFGDPGEEYVVEISPTMLTSTGLSTASIAQQIAGDRAERPAGNLRAGDTSLPLAIDSDRLPIQRIENALIAYGARGHTTQLSRIARVERRLVDPASNMAIIRGRRGVVLGAMVSDELRVDHWSERIDRVLADFSAEYSREVSVEVLFSQREQIDRRMSDLLGNLAIGTSAVMLVVLLLMGWRSMIVVGVALPLSALIVLAAMRALAIPIHQMSVTGLILALGLLIDNAIVIVEDVRSRIVSGAAAAAAIRGGVRHLAMPLFGSTLTTALAFLPIATLPGPPGEFVGTIAISVILAISASFLLAMTLIPALTGLLRIDPSTRSTLAYGLSIRPLGRIYEFSLRRLFHWPLVGVGLGLILPFLGFYAASRLPEQFFPPSDRRQIQIEVELPFGETISATRKTVASMYDAIGAFEQVDQQYWFIGRSGPTFYYNVVPRRRATPFYAQAFVDLSIRDEIGSFVRELQTELDRQVPQGRVIVRQFEQGPPFDAPIEIRLFGPDLTTLQDLGSELRGLLGQTPDVTHTRSDLEETVARLSLDVDEFAAKSVGLDKSRLSAQLYTSVEGAPAGSIYEGNEELPVRVRLALSGEDRMKQLAALPLQTMTRGASPIIKQPGGPPTQSGSAFGHATVDSLTRLKLGSDVGAIVRIDGQRANEVKAYLKAGVLPSTVIANFKRRLADADFVLPDGYSLQFGGETEQRAHAVHRLLANGAIVFALMLLTLVAAFRSFRAAFIVAAVGALSIGLGPLALSAFGYPFGFMAIVGSMGLVGVAINDSIVVLAAVRADAAASVGDIEGLVIVVIGCTRHIIATTLTTIVGFMPLIIAGGGFWPPLAITIAGGVAGATLLALYFVPSMQVLLVRVFGAAK